MARSLERLGYEVGSGLFFDTLRIALGQKKAADLLKAAESQGMNFRLIDEHTLGISLDETTTEQDLAGIIRAVS